MGQCGAAVVKHHGGKNTEHHKGDGAKQDGKGQADGLVLQPRGADLDRVPQGELGADKGTVLFGIELLLHGIGIGDAEDLLFTVLVDAVDLLEALDILLARGNDHIRVGVLQKALLRKRLLRQPNR